MTATTTLCGSPATTTTHFACGHPNAGLRGPHGECMTPTRVYADRAETDTCQAGTPGCCIDHSVDTDGCEGF